MNVEVILKISKNPKSRSTDQTEWMQVNSWNSDQQAPCCAGYYPFSCWVLKRSTKGSGVENKAAEEVVRELKGASGIKVFHNFNKMCGCIHILFQCHLNEHECYPWHPVAQGFHVCWKEHFSSSVVDRLD